jgi:hypothetical protein
MQCNELAHKVRATTNALTHIWGFNGQQNYELAHTLAAYFTFKPAALLEDLITLGLTVPKWHQSLGCMVFSNMENLLTQPLHKGNGSHHWRQSLFQPVQAAHLLPWQGLTQPSSPIVYQYAWNDVETGCVLEVLYDEGEET